jgi:hypothetical protein
MTLSCWKNAHFAPSQYGIFAKDFEKDRIEAKQGNPSVHHWVEKATGRAYCHARGGNTAHNSF